MDMSNHVCDSSHACQDLHRHLLPPSLSHHGLPQNHVRPECGNRRRLDLQHPRHHLPMPPSPRSVGLYSPQGLPSNRLILLFHHGVFHLHRLLAVHPAAAGVLEAQAPNKTKVHCLITFRRRPLRNGGISSADQRTQERRQLGRHDGIRFHHEMVRCRGWNGYHLRLHTLPEASVQELLARQELFQQVGRKSVGRDGPTYTEVRDRQRGEA